MTFSFAVCIISRILFETEFDFNKVQENSIFKCFYYTNFKPLLNISEKQAITLSAVVFLVLHCYKCPILFSDIPFYFTYDYDYLTAYKLKESLDFLEFRGYINTKNLFDIWGIERQYYDLTTSFIKQYLPEFYYGECPIV